MFQDVTITAGALTPVSATPSATVTGGPEPTQTPANGDDDDDEGDDDNEQPGQGTGDDQDDGDDDGGEGSSSTESSAGPTATSSTGGMPQVTGRVGSILSGLAIALAAAVM
jgi:hypothetical protein